MTSLVFPHLALCMQRCFLRVLAHVACSFRESCLQLCTLRRWLGHGTMALLTLHGWGFWALWLWEGEYIRGFYWDSHGTNMLAGAVSWLSGAALWVTATSYVRRNYFEARMIITAVLFPRLQSATCSSGQGQPCGG